MNDPNRTESFRLLYESTYGHVLAYALRRTERAEDAAEVVAETFLIAWRRYEDVPDGENALPWLYGVARRVLANLRRSTSRRRQLTERLGGLAEPIASPDMEVSELAPARAAYARLSSNDREWLGLVGWEGLGYSELAEVMGCSRNAARIRVYRARRRFARELARVGVDVKWHEHAGHEPEGERRFHSGAEEAL